MSFRGPLCFGPELAFGHRFLVSESQGIHIVLGVPAHCQTRRGIFKIATKISKGLGSCIVGAVWINLSGALTKSFLDSSKIGRGSLKLRRSGMVRRWGEMTV
jgi:hypothetical protein